MSLNSITQIAKDYNFELVYKDRRTVKEVKEEIYGINLPFDFDKYANDQNILEDIRSNYQKVEPIDLITRHFEICFKKL